MLPVQPDKRSWVLAVSLLLAAGGGVRAAPGPAPEAAPATLLWPSQGRPVFVQPGGVLVVAAQPTDPAATLSFELVSTRAPSLRLPLTPMPTEGGLGEVYRFDVPVDAPERTYDLEVRGPSGTTVGRHAVAVARLGRRVRLVHLGDMHVGELGVPDFDQRLIDEINLVAPTLVVASGDYLDVTHPEPDAGWRRLADFLARFDAPVLLACGDHDDLALYSRYMAPSPIGTIELGAYRGLVLYGLPSRPISADAEQVAWIERELADTPAELRMTLVVGHDDGRDLVAHWQRGGVLTEIVNAGRVGLWLAGGWMSDRPSPGSILPDAEVPMIGLRTPPASSTTRHGAAGVAHFRVLDIEGERVTFWGPVGPGGLPGAIPVGRLHLSFDQPNDGRRDRVALTVVNSLPFRLDHVGVRVLLRRDGDRRLWCQGGRLERATAVGEVWDCRVALDLPDKGSVRAVVGTGAPPLLPDVAVRFAGPRALSVGPDFVVVDEWKGSVELTNRGPQTVEIMPLLRLDGEPVAYRVREEEGPLATAYHLRLAPRQRITLQPDMLALKIEPGRRELQVYVTGGATGAPVCWPLDVVTVP